MQISPLFLSSQRSRSHKGRMVGWPLPSSVLARLAWVQIPLQITAAAAMEPLSLSPLLCLFPQTSAAPSHFEQHILTIFFSEMNNFWPVEAPGIESK